MFDDRGYTKLKINGFTLFLRKLSPIYFLDEQVYPLCNLNVIQKVKSEKEENFTEDEIEQRKDLIIQKSVIKIRKGLKKYSLKEINLNYVNKMFLFNKIVQISLGNKIYNLNNDFAITLFNLAKTYSILPSEIIKLNNFDWGLNILVTNIGLENDYRNQLISQLKSYNVSVSGEPGIESLEKMLESAIMRAKNGH